VNWFYSLVGPDALPNTYAVDWVDSLIGQGGLLLLVSHIFAVRILGFMGGVGNKK
jgi:hypothetical protein